MDSPNVNLDLLKLHRRRSKGPWKRDTYTLLQAQATHCILRCSPPRHRGLPLRPREGGVGSYVRGPCNTWDEKSTGWVGVPMRLRPRYSASLGRIHHGTKPKATDQPSPRLQGVTSNNLFRSFAHSLTRLFSNDIFIRVALASHPSTILSRHLLHRLHLVTTTGDIAVHIHR